MASGSQIRPLGLAISRKQLGRTGSHSAGQPRLPQLQPIRGQIFWEPLYKPQLGSQLFPGKRSASRSPAAGWPREGWDRARGSSEQGRGQRRQLGLEPTPVPSLCSHLLAERPSVYLSESQFAPPHGHPAPGAVPGNTDFTPNTLWVPEPCLAWHQLTPRGPPTPVQGPETCIFNPPRDEVIIQAQISQIQGHTTGPRLSRTPPLPQPHQAHTRAGSERQSSKTVAVVLPCSPRRKARPRDRVSRTQARDVLLA